MNNGQKYSTIINEDNNRATNKTTNNFYTTFFNATLLANIRIFSAILHPPNRYISIIYGLIEYLYTCLIPVK